MEGNRAVNPCSNGDMRRKADIGQKEAEIERLLRLAAYYQRLGCLNVAVSLRALAEAKKVRQTSGSGDEETL